MPGGELGKPELGLLCVNQLQKCPADPAGLCSGWTMFLGFPWWMAIQPHWRGPWAVDDLGGDRT